MSRGSSAACTDRWRCSRSKRRSRWCSGRSCGNRQRRWRGSSPVWRGGGTLPLCRASPAHERAPGTQRDGVKSTCGDRSHAVEVRRDDRLASAVVTPAGDGARSSDCRRVRISGRNCGNGTEAIWNRALVKTIGPKPRNPELRGLRGGAAGSATNHHYDNCGARHRSALLHALTSKQVGIGGDFDAGMLACRRIRISRQQVL